MEWDNDVLLRFCLYGFLKNQRYYEPFLILALMEKGLSFFTIGLLVAFRETVVNVVEIPSGAIADVWGRRGSMMVSFAVYIVSFALFGLATGVHWLFAAMLALGVADAFRTGTHKAMIFAWLRLQGRTEERSKIYGLTRSWSKLGSALAVVIAAAFVLISDNYVHIFYVSILPCVASIANLSAYPRELDGEGNGKGTGPKELFNHLRATFRDTLRGAELRRVIVESIGFDGLLQSAKHYLQPVLRSVAIILTAQLVVLEGLSETQSSALLVGPVYLILHLLSAAASRNAHVLVQRADGEEGAARFLWGVTLCLFAALAVSAWNGIASALIAAFVLLHATYDMWRPILVSRIDRLGDPRRAATVLSVESQSRRLATVALAPALGYAVDSAGAMGELVRFWPVGLVGTAVALVFLVTAHLRRSSAEPVTDP